MKDYLLTILVAAIAVALVDILTPNGERGGIASRQRLLTALFLVCILIRPLAGAIETFRGLANGGIDLFERTDEATENDYREQMDQALDGSSKRYFTQMLTQTLCERFSIAGDELRCNVTWREDKNASPERVTVILSGKAIWKDPHAIEAFVSSLLGCECQTAIE